MSLVVYADDSGTHDPTGRLVGSEAPVFGGYMSDTDGWASFTRDWESVLRSYKVPYFHWREFNKKNVMREGAASPYHGWGDVRRLTFLFELAAVAGWQVPVGAMIQLQDYVKPPGDQHPWRTAFDIFFGNTQSAIRSNWPGNNDAVTFILDQTNNEEWVKHFIAEFNIWKLKEPRFKDYAFGDKKDERHLPLQAADLISAAIRRKSLLRLAGGVPLDLPAFTPMEALLYQALLRKNFPNPAPVARYRRLAAATARYVIRADPLSSRRK